MESGHIHLGPSAAARTVNLEVLNLENVIQGPFRAVGSEAIDTEKGLLVGIYVCL